LHPFGKQTKEVQKINVLESTIVSVRDTLSIWSNKRHSISVLSCFSSQKSARYIFWIQWKERIAENILWLPILTFGESIDCTLILDSYNDCITDGSQFLCLLVLVNIVANIRCIVFTKHVKCIKKACPKLVHVRNTKSFQN